MDAQLTLEEKHDLLKSRLDENLEKKHALELRISQQFEELKRLEISAERCARALAKEKKAGNDTGRRGKRRLDTL